MGTYGDKLKYSKSYDETLTPILCRVLLVFALAVPVLIVVTRVGLYRLTDPELIAASAFLFMATVVPYFLNVSKMPSYIVKYYIALSVVVTVGVIALMPGANVNIAYMLGIAVALIYLDTRLMLITSLVSYVVMLVSLFLKSAGIFFNGGIQTFNMADTMASFVPVAYAVSIEFFCMLPIFILACHLARRHLVAEEDLFLELSTEEERYKLAFEGSKDVIFDYVYDTARLTYFGSVTDKDDDNHTEHVVNHAFDVLAAGNMVHQDDIPKVIDLLSGGTGEAISVRLCDKVPGEYIWIRIEGRIVKKGDKNIRVVGKVTDISEEKKREDNLLENAKKDQITGFFTWDIGEKLIDRLELAGTMNMCFLFFKILNLDTITEQYGTFFSDAIISRIAEMTRSLLREEDYVFRINNETFAAVLVDVDEEMLSIIHASLERSLEHIYTGGTDLEGIDYIVRYVKEKEKFLELVAGESTTQIVSGRKTGDIDYDEVSFTFNILEHSKELSSSMMMLLEHIGSRFNIMSIHILEKDEAPGIETCLYDWTSAPGGSRFKAGERRESDLADLQMAYDMLRRNEYIIIDNSFIANVSNESRSRVAGSHTSHFIVPIYSGGEIYGVVDYEHLNVDYVWPESTKATLMEMTRCMSTYILRDRADSASRAKSDFLTSISHEVRTPLNAISGFSELLLAKNDIDDETRKYTQGIKGSADNLLSVISGILDFSKIESGDVEILNEKFRVTEMVTNLYRMVILSVEEKGLELNVSYDGDVPDGLIGDEQRIKQVLINLLSNAVKFTHTGHVDFVLSFESNDDELGILHADVKDTGVGIREDAIETIFDSFQYADKTQNKSTKGVGLGLSISRNLLHMMGGDISCESVFGSGSTFSISIPVQIFDSKPAIFDPDYVESTDDERFHVPFICPDAKILIVDDNKVNLEVAKGLVGQYLPDIKAVTSGDEALNVFFSEHDFDLIFMDHMMPKMDGIECVSHLRKLDVAGAADVPVVALTANAVKDAKKFFLSSGMDDYLPKPIKLDELADIMNRWIPEKYKKPIEDAEYYVKPKLIQESRSVPEGTESGEETALRGIDYEAGLKNVMGSPEIYKELLETFMESDSLGQAEQFYRQRNLEDYRITVHALKSSARYIGADGLSDKARELEEMARNEDWAGIDAEHPNLIPMYDEVAASIKKYLGIEDAESDDSPQLEESDIIEKAVLKERLEELLGMLNDMEYDSATDIASRLKHISYIDETVQDELDAVIHLIDNFDFEEAEERLATMIAWGFGGDGSDEG